MRKLDLGCGYAKVEGAIGVDIAPLPQVDVVANLDRIPYPFADNLFDAIYLNDVIEHLPNTIQAMEELYRIAKPNAHVYIRVIHWSSEKNATDPTHVRAFTDKSFHYFGSFKDRLYYSTARFDVLSVRRDYNPRVQRYVRSRRVLNFLSTHLNNIIDGLHFDLQAKKGDPAPDGVAASEDLPLESLLRCPYCLSVRKQRGWLDRPLRRLNRNWLVCEEQGCQRKFPVAGGLPFFRLEDERAWRLVPIQELPNILPDDYRRVQ